MAASYDTSKNIICINNTYGDTCVIDKNINDFLHKIKLELKKLVVDISSIQESTYIKIEKKIIDFLCNAKYIFPVEFSMLQKNTEKKKYVVNNINSILKEFETQHNDTNIAVENIIAESLGVYNNIVNTTMLTDSDPNTNKY